MCNDWWTDPKTNDSYALHKLDHQEENYYQLMQDMFTYGWTTPEDLFLGSDRCMNEVFRGFPMEHFVGALQQWLLFFHSPYPTLDIQTLDTRCFSNLRVCTWNQTNSPAAKDGYEFEVGMGCGFAWPNICVDGQGFKTSEFLTNHSDLKFGEYFDKDDILNLDSTGESLENSMGSAFIYQNVTIPAYHPDYLYAFWSHGIFLNQSGYDGANPLWRWNPEVELLGFNSQYDMLNNRLGVLQQQANDARYKECRELPQGSDRPGWGGGGYHQKNKDCDKIPASYLGPGLFNVASFCGP